MASNFFNKASLVMVPDAPIDGKLPSVKPEDRSGDFTFSRGSNLAATRVNKDGLIEKGRENLLLQSNQFDTTPWTLPNASVTSGQEGYDGSNDAWLLNKVNSDGYLRQNVSGSLNTFSIYAKKGTLDWVRLGSTTFTLVGAFFDLSNGVVGSSNNLISSKIESIGNGWYRCSITLDSNPNSVRVFPADSDGVTSGTSGNIYIQDAQLELGLVATGYIETTTATVQKGILENLPRLDYSGGASCPSLLLEPQRSNLITHSEYFETSEWTTPNVVFETNKAISPDGEFNATKFKANSANSTHWASTDLTLTSGQDYTFKLYVKSAEYDWVQIALFGTGWVGSTKKINFNASTGEFGTTDTGITFDSNPMGNGWHEVIITNEAASTSGVVRVYPMPSDNATSYQGDGASGIYIYGAQFEQGSYPTSYIPTYGSSVTRSNEFLDAVSYNTTLPTSAFTLFFDFGKTQAGIGSGYIYRMDIDGTNTEFDLYQNPFSGGGLNVYLNGQGGYVFGTGGNDAWNADASKVAISYDGDKLSYFINGSLYNSITGISFIDAGTKPNFRVSNSSPQFDLKQYLSFPTALTNDECIALTTI